MGPKGKEQNEEASCEYAIPASLQSFCYLNGSPMRGGRDFRGDMDRIVAEIKALRGDAVAATRDDYGRPAPVPR